MIGNFRESRSIISRLLSGQPGLDESELYILSATDCSWEGNEVSPTIEEFASAHQLPPRWVELRNACCQLVARADFWYRADLRDAVRLVIHLDELADDRAIGDSRLPIERSTVELDRDASGGGLQRGGRRSPPAPPLRAFCALSAAIRFFSALSRFGPFCFGT